MQISSMMLEGFKDELMKIAEIPMSFFSQGSPMAQKAKQVASGAASLVKKAPALPSAASGVVSSAPPLASLLKK